MIRYRPIAAADDSRLTHLIRTVLRELKCDRSEYLSDDSELDGLSRQFAEPGANYWVVEDNGLLVGGGGYRALAGGDGATAELQKMYLGRQARGKGIGVGLTKQIEAGARDWGYARMYLETMPEMTAAVGLYKRLGFRQLERPMGDTGHSSCGIYMLKNL